MFLRNILSKRFTCKHWDFSAPVNKSNLDYVLDCVYLAPSKMAYHRHKIVILTDTAEAQAIKDWLFYEHTWNSNGDRANPLPTDMIDYNGQYMAPVVLLWLNQEKDFPKHSVTFENNTFEVDPPGYVQRQNDIFISATVAMLAAEEKGLNTGFGSCHDHIEVAKKLGYEGYRCPIALGIGKAKDTTQEESLHGMLLPVYDKDDNKVGTSLANIKAHRHYPDRENKQSKQDMFKII